MRCHIDGREINSQALARREMNFAQAFPGSDPPLCYEISVPTVEFLATLRDLYHQYVQEEIADAPYHHLGDWPLLDRLQELAYPPLELLADKHADLLAELVRDWLNLETLDLLIPGPKAGLPEYLVNTVDRVAVDPEWVRIQGQAYRHPALVQQT